MTNLKTKKWEFNKPVSSLKKLDRFDGLIMLFYLERNGDFDSAMRDYTATYLDILHPMPIPIATDYNSTKTMRCRLKKRMRLVFENHIRPRLQQYDSE